MLAKGWLLGLQFLTLLENGLYFDIAEHADKMAQMIHDAFAAKGNLFLYDSPTNQQFPILKNADLEKLQILEILYKGEKISMLILLPRQGEDYDLERDEKIISNYTLNDIELSSSKLNEYKAQMKETKLDAIYLPKFEFDSKYSLTENLKSLGMPSAFNPSLADFSGMTGKKDLSITNVIHQAYIKVDEQGTEAAAATAVMMAGNAAITPRNIFRADHPFIFIIQERETGNILFLARVNNPNQ
ncbi:hypothetical protein EOM09_06165 [bacterium]|nr:hypothetical protein [bacterium]